MVSVKRIHESYNYYFFREPSNEESSINRFKIIRERLEKILKSPKLRSIRMAMGSDMLPFQDIIFKMNKENFSEFIDDNTFGSRRNEIYLNYKKPKEEIYEDRMFSFQLNTTFTGAIEVMKELKEFLKNTNWNYKHVKIQLVK